MIGKANNAADCSGTFTPLPEGTRFLDGTPVATAIGGVITDTNGNYYSLAHPEMVAYGAETLERAPEGHVLANRLGRISLHNNSQSLPTTYGAELEFTRGNSETFEWEPASAANEIFNFMHETGTDPTDNPDEFERAFAKMCAEEIHRAEALGQLTVPLAVHAQRVPRADELTADPYIQHTARLIEASSGFPTEEMYRVGSVQFHTLISNTEAALHAMEAAQYLLPIQMAPSLAGPFLSGGIAARLPHATLTDYQRQCLERADVNVGDFTGMHQSWRYVLRRAASAGAGIWQRPAPDTTEAYLEYMDLRLAQKAVNTGDRLFGPHADRLRSILQQTGASTAEWCGYDTFLGHPVIAPNIGLLGSAVFTRLEALAMRGEDPRELVASALGIAAMSRQERLRTAHVTAMRRTSVLGNDANVYGKMPHQWLPYLFELADAAPFPPLNDRRKQIIRRAFASYVDTKDAIDKWCIDHNTNTPTAATYYDLGVNNAATYMQLHKQELRLQNPHQSEGEQIRRVEHVAATAFHMRYRD